MKRGIGQGSELDKKITKNTLYLIQKTSQRKWGERFKQRPEYPGAGCYVQESWCECKIVGRIYEGAKRATGSSDFLNKIGRRV